MFKGVSWLRGEIKLGRNLLDEFVACRGGGLSLGNVQQLSSEIFYHFYPLCKKEKVLSPESLSYLRFPFINVQQ